MSIAVTAPARRARVRIGGPVLDGIGLGLTFVVFAWFVARGMWRPPNTYDEGILLSNAEAVRHGVALYRDRYSNYPPGIFWTVAAAFSVTGPSYLAVRALGVGVHVWLALLAGRLGGRLVHRRFSWLACGLNAVWLMRLLAIPFAWLVALALLLTAVDAATSAPAGRPWSTRRTMAIGALVGAVGVYRHDLFAYTVCALIIVVIVDTIRLRSLPSAPARRTFLVAAAAASVVLAAVWVPTLLRAGLSPVLGDLWLDQTRRVLPHRRIPFSMPLVLNGPGGIGLPAPLADSWPGGMLLAALAPFAAWALWRRTRSPLPWMLGAVSVATLPQLLQRADGTHALYTVTPGLVLVGALAEHWCRRAHTDRRPIGAAMVSALIIPTWSAHLAFAVPAPYDGGTRISGRFGGTVELEPARHRARQEVVDWIRSTVPPGRPFWSGCSDHLQSSANELDLYFLAGRPGPTKWLQFDPGLQDSPEIQRRIIADFERTRPPAAVLADCERTDVGHGGRSPLLDRYLERTYRVERTLPGYRLLVRR